MGAVADDDTFIDDEDFRGSKVVRVDFQCEYLDAEVIRMPLLFI